MSLAGSVRNAWFKFLGSTAGFTYDSNIFQIVTVAVTCWGLENGEVVYYDSPVEGLTLQLIDSSGNVAASLPLDLPGPVIVLNVPGVFVTWEDYNLVVVGPDQTALVYLGPPPDAGADPGTFGQPGSQDTALADGVAGTYLRNEVVYLSIALGYDPTGATNEATVAALETQEEATAGLASAGGSGGAGSSSGGGSGGQIEGNAATATATRRSPTTPTATRVTSNSGRTSGQATQTLRTKTLVSSNSVQTQSAATTAAKRVASSGSTAARTVESGAKTVASDVSKAASSAGSALAKAFRRL